jgi:hypothetical protein
MILRLTPTTAALVGETPAEWQLLEKPVRAGRWTSGPRAEEGGLRTLSAELGVAVREEGVVRTRQRRCPRPPHAWNRARLTSGLPTPTRWWRSEKCGRPGIW